MAKYQKKPVVIEAIQWNGNNLKEIIDFIGLHPSNIRSGNDRFILLPVKL